MNLCAFYRYNLLRLRFRNLRVRHNFFFLNHGYKIKVGPNAHIRFGQGGYIERNFTGIFYGNITIGKKVYFNVDCYVSVLSRLIIGDNCLFGERVSIHDENHVMGCDLEPISSRGFVVKPITIGNNVWVGANATILQGVNIGDNAVIGANAVVTHDVPANTVVGGVPARVLREIKTSSLPEEQNYVHSKVF